ncbi:MAG: hypothetical protein Q9192_004781 [Flavoplaca navasiana]
MHLISTHRSFGAFLVLLVSAILLSTWSHGPTTRLAKRHDANEEALLNDPTAAVPIQTLGVHDYQHNLSKIHVSPVLEKRARTLTYDAAVCKGRELYNNLILRAFNGQGTGARDYGENDINNGWTKEPLTRLIPSGMDEAFKFIGKNIFPDIGERIPTFEETKLINLVQDKDFTNSAGKKQKAIPMQNNLLPHYEAYYIPLYHALISTDSRSPKYQLRDAGLSPAALNARVPPLNRQSDVMWSLYKSLAPFPADLRFIARDSIINDDTRGIMNDIFLSLPARAPLVWPGVSFSIDTDEAKALLATPNGLATAYILADRVGVLGTRRLSVRIWASYPDAWNEGYRMLWDMEPGAVGPRPSGPPSLTLPVFEPISLTERGVEGRVGIEMTGVAGPVET